MPFIIFQILVFLIFPSLILGQSEKPQTIIVPTGSLGDISEIRKKMLEKTLESKLDDHFDIVPKDLFEEAQEKAFEELNYDECTEDQCIMMIKEILQVENAFQLVLMSEEGDTQISLTWNDLDKKRVEEDYCEGCKTKELRKVISGLVNKLVGKTKEIEIKEEPPKKVESKPKNVTEKKSESVQKKLPSNEEWTEPKTGMQFVKIPGKSYWMGKYEVTQGEWEKVFGFNPSSIKSSGFTVTENHPVEGVSWVDVQRYIFRLNKLSNKTFRLPLDEEWQYACEGGNFNTFGTDDGGLSRKKANWGNDLCCDENAEDGFEKTAPVGSYPSNNYGIYDLSGNVREWIENKETILMAVEDKAGIHDDMPTGELCLYRGGSFTNTPGALFCNAVDQREICKNSGFKARQIGFRLIMEKNKKSDLSSDTVIDPSTGLMWQKKPDLLRVSWENAIKYCDNLVFADRNDWFLPHKYESEKLINNEKILHNSKTEMSYWTATKFEGIYGDGRRYNAAYVVNHYYNKILGPELGTKLNVRCARRSQ